MTYRLSPFAEEDLVVYSRIERDVVVISRVFHGSRDQAAAWQESPEEQEP